MRAAIKLFLLGLLTFALAFILRRVFFWDVMPVSWDQEPPQTGALEAAFLLLSIENIAAVVSALALVFAAWLLIVRGRLARSLPQRHAAPPANAKE